MNASTGLKHILVSGVIEVVAGTAVIHEAAVLSLHKRECIYEGPGQQGGANIQYSIFIHPGEGK